MSYASLTYHLITGTKDRRPFLRDDMLPRLVKYLGGIVRSMNGQLIEGNGGQDHLHLVAMLDATRSIADVMRNLKANSSSWIHAEIGREFGWQDGYSAFTVSHSQIAAVVQYVRSQPEHHRKMSFDEELMRLLKLHEVEFDPRFVTAAGAVAPSGLG